MNIPPYPLEQLASIKKKRFDEAVKVLEEKKTILEKAYEKLYTATENYNKVFEHKTSKLEQLRKAMDEGESSTKIISMRHYLKEVDEKLIEKKQAMTAAQKAVDQAQQAVDAATDDLFQKKKEVEKLEIHKQEWLKEMRQQVERKESIEHDEQGAATHEILKHEHKRRKKHGK